MERERIILGIDPGTNAMGYGLIACKSNQASLIKFDVVKTSGESFEKLSLIFNTILDIIDRYKPGELSIESTFYGKNIQSMLKLGRAQGMAIAAALFRGLKVTEYSPRRIKQSVTGRGNASKEQVAAMLSRILGEALPVGSLDATDALAAAVCHFLQKDASVISAERAYKSWKDFVAENPGKSKK